MIEEAKENEINNQQKYFICFQCCFWIYQVIVIALGLTIMTILIMNYNNTQNVLNSSLYAHAQETVVLWNKGYIIDIRAQLTNNCAEGYIPLISYQWSGTVDGCFCKSTGSSNSYQFTMVGKCNSQLTSLGCKGVSPMSAQTLNMWKGSSLICYKRAQSMNFYNSILLTAPKGGTSSNMSTCSFGQSYEIHTLPGVPCPITIVSNASVGSSQTILTLDSVNGYSMNFNNQTGYPIADFKLTEYQFCQFFNQTNISPNKKGSYTLGLKTVTTSCSKTDPRMINIDSLNEQDFYTNNTRVYQLMTTLPSFPQSSVDYNYILGYIPYPTWTFQCRNSSNFNLWKATSNLLFQDPLKMANLTISISIPCILIFAILFRIFFIIRHIVDLKNRSNYNALLLSDDQIAEQIPNISIKKSLKKQLLLFIIECILLSAVFGIIIYSIVTLTKNSIWIKQTLQFQCTDSYLSKIFLYYEGIIDNSSSVLISAAFIWVALFCIQIIYFVVRVKIGDLNIKEDVVEQISSISSVSQEPVQILEKQGKLESINMQDSSDIILNLNKENNSQFIVQDIELIGDGGGETKDNFHPLDREASINVLKKKKKRKVVNTKKKNLFKQDQP